MRPICSLFDFKNDLLKGILNKPEAISIPNIEPIPKIKMYTNPSVADFICVSTKATKAPLPAKPCTKPTPKAALNEFKLLEWLWLEVVV